MLFKYVPMLHSEMLTSIATRAGLPWSAVQSSNGEAVKQVFAGIGCMSTVYVTNYHATVLQKVAFKLKLTQPHVLAQLDFTDEAGPAWAVKH